MTARILLLVVVAESLAFAQVPPEVRNPHDDRMIMVESKDGKTTASLGGELAVFTVYDETKKGGGGEGYYFEPIATFKVDLTHKLGESSFLGLALDFVEPESALLSIEDERNNRVNSRGFLYGPQWRTVKAYWRYFEDGAFWQIDAGRDRFLGIEPLFGEYQGSVPLILRNTLYWDNGISVSHEQYSEAGKLFGFRAAILDGEGWVGLENSRFQNSSPSIGAEGDIHPLTILAPEWVETFGDIGLLLSWTNAEGGSNPGTKEDLSHILYGVSYSRDFWGLDFTTRLIAGTIKRGRTDTSQSAEETWGWAWENRLSGIKFLEGNLSPYFALASANHESGQNYWLWKSSATTFEREVMFGADYENPFGLSKSLSLEGAYFHKEMDGEKTWNSLGGNGGFVGIKYRF